MLVDIEQVRKYDVPGPRYTSYPPAVHFRHDFDEKYVTERLKADHAEDRDLSLYFHIPFCRSLCWYCGCNMLVTRDQSQSAKYLQYLEKEVALLSSLLDRGRKVTQVHLGGGTPTFLLPDEIRQLGQLIRKHFQVAPVLEAGVEIDPRRMTWDHVAALRDAGMNRASLGVQDFNPQVQKAINRIQPYEQTRQVVEWVRAAGFESLSIDLIYGLPFQSEATFRDTLEKTLSLNPDRLALFSYAHVPWVKPAQKLLKRNTMPSAEEKFAILKLAIETLTGAGYAYIGMDHFARRGDELEVAQRTGQLQRNFQGYSTHAGADILAFGVSSISQTPDMYWQNEKNLAAYYARLDDGRLPIVNGYVLTDEDRVRRQVIMRVMCDMKLDFGAMSERLGIDFPENFARELDALHALEADGLVHLHESGFEVTDSGRLLIRNIAMCFDAYLGNRTEGVYSRTV